MTVTLLLVPVSTGEIGEAHGSTVVVHAQCAQLGQTAPFGQVIDIHVEGQTVLQAVHHSAVHDEVHTTVSHVAAQFAILGQDGVIVFLGEGILLFLAQEHVCIEVVHLGSACSLHGLSIQGIVLFGVLGGIALGTGKFEQAVVGLWGHHVVLDFHHLSVCRAHEGGSVVTVSEVVAFASGLLLHIFLAHNTLGVHGHEGGEAVTAVDVETLCHGAQAVGGIHVTTVLLVVLHAPVEVLCVVGFRILPVGTPEVVQVVDVRTFGTQNLTEDALLCHVQ